MPEYLAPGVYVEETSFRAKSIEGVATSTAGFVGQARFGPTAGLPTLVTGFEEFQRHFGDGNDLLLDLIHLRCEFSGKAVRVNRGRSRWYWGIQRLRDLDGCLRILRQQGFFHR